MKSVFFEKTIIFPLNFQNLRVSSYFGRSNIKSKYLSCIYKLRSL